MTRVFRAHELKQAILEALAEHGPANGYAIMQVLADRIGPSWRPSPGAIYPALLALQDLGLIGAIDNGTGRTYHLEGCGSAVVARNSGTLDRVGRRAKSISRQTNVGILLDHFATTHPNRRRTVDTDTETRIEAVLAGAAEKISAMTAPPEETP